MKNQWLIFLSVTITCCTQSQPENEIETPKQLQKKAAIEVLGKCVNLNEYDVVAIKTEEVLDSTIKYEIKSKIHDGEWTDCYKMKEGDYAVFVHNHPTHMIREFSVDSLKRKRYYKEYVNYKTKNLNQWINYDENENPLPTSKYHKITPETFMLGKKNNFRFEFFPNKDYDERGKFIIVKFWADKKQFFNHTISFPAKTDTFSIIFPDTLTEKHKVYSSTEFTFDSENKPGDKITHIIFQPFWPGK